MERSASEAGDHRAAAPQTVGEHLRRKRLVARLTQREVADRIGVTAATVFNWEANRTSPHVQHIPAVIEFLGYEPVVEYKQTTIT